MFLTLLLNARERGLSVGISEHDTLLTALERGLATDLPGLYALGRAIYCRSETEYDAWDLAFAQTFRDVKVAPELAKKLEDWLSEAKAQREGEAGSWDHLSRDELFRQLMERLKEQTERHDGGNKWVGTGGTSPFGHSGRARGGLRVGGSGGGRQAVGVAMERRWAGYRSDTVLDVRDTKVALRSLRALTREGAWELDLDATIQATGRNAGDLSLIERRERQNKVDLVLLMDAGGSMGPHARQVERLFTAATQTHTFKRLRTFTFHNCIYTRLHANPTDSRRGHIGEPHETADVLASLSARTRLLFVGDASMAPYELFSPMSWPGHSAPSGLQWLERFRTQCPASVWLNPDPKRYWRHPTVSAIGALFPMFELTLDGLRDAIRALRAPL